MLKAVNIIFLILCSVIPTTTADAAKIIKSGTLCVRRDHFYYEIWCAGDGNPTPDLVLLDDQNNEISTEIYKNDKEVSAYIFDCKIKTKYVKCIVENEYGKDIAHIDVKTSGSIHFQDEQEVIDVGTDVTLNASFENKVSIPPNMKWEKFDEQSQIYKELVGVSLDSRYRVYYADSQYQSKYTFSKNDAVLTILNFQNEDCGSYRLTCEINNAVLNDTIYVCLKDKVKLINEDTKIIGSVGNDVSTIQCLANGCPRPEISFFNDKYIPFNESLIAKYKNGKTATALFNVTMPTKFVICVAKNKYGEDSTQIELPRRDPPKIMRERTYIVAPITHRFFKIQCVANGSPIPDIDFYDDESRKIISKFIHIFISGNEKRAILKYNTKTSAVKCFAYNKHGNDSVTVEIQQSVTFGNMEETQTFVSGDNVTIPIQIFSITLPDMTWDVYNREVEEFEMILFYDVITKQVIYGNNVDKSRFTMNERNYGLQISNIKREDSGIYKFSVHCNTGWISKFITVFVEATAKILKHKTSIIKSSNHEKYQLQCAGKGYPPPKIKFYNDQNEKYNETEIMTTQKSEDENIAVLTTNVETIFVKCKVSNKYGEESLDIHLPKVKFGNMSENYYFTLGETAHINVSILSDSLPDITWERYSCHSHQYNTVLTFDRITSNIHYIGVGGRHRYNMDNKTGSLQIFDFKTSDISLYRITLKRFAGRYLKTINVRLKETIQYPRINSDVGGDGNAGRFDDNRKQAFEQEISTTTDTKLTVTSLAVIINVGIVLIIAGGYYIYQKKKKKDQKETLENELFLRNDINKGRMNRENVTQSIHQLFKKKIAANKELTYNLSTR